MVLFYLTVEYSLWLLRFIDCDFVHFQGTVVYFCGVVPGCGPVDDGHAGGAEDDRARAGQIGDGAETD